VETKVETKPIQIIIQCIQMTGSGGASGAAAPLPDRPFVMYGAPVHQVMNIYIYTHNLQNL